MGIELTESAPVAGGVAGEDACGPLAPGGEIPPHALSLPTVMAALSDPIRLRIVSELADGAERTCGAFELPIAKSTRSHHFSVLVDAGILRRRVDGKTRKLRLRRDELDQRFPGLLDAVLGAIER